MKKTHFEWDEVKDKKIRKSIMCLLRLHNMLFSTLTASSCWIWSIVLRRIDIIASDVLDEGIMTVRFTFRGNVISLYGAGYWRKGRKIYEEQN